MYRWSIELEGIFVLPLAPRWVRHSYLSKEATIDPLYLWVINRGGEYLSYEFGLHLKQCGIVSQLTPAGTPQRNGVFERRNRTLLDMVRSMMSLTDLPLSFWGYALETAAFTLNRAPSKSVETTPYEL